MLDVLAVQTPPSGPTLGILREAQNQPEVDQLRFGNELNVFEQRRKRAGCLGRTEDVPFDEQFGGFFQQICEVATRFDLRRERAEDGEELAGGYFEAGKVGGFESELVVMFVIIAVKLQRRAQTPF